MSKIKFGLLISLAALASGCATFNKQPQQPTTYWTDKSGTPVVHHLVGKVDHVETLSKTPLTSDEAEAFHLPKGKYFKVVVHVDAPTKPAKDAPKAKTDAKDAKDNLAGVKSQLDDLKKQISTISADNKHLHEQLENSPKQNSQPAPTPGQPQERVDGLSQ
jgi:hypothetical protein